MDNEAYVKVTAEAVGLSIPEEYLAGTVANFERSAALAKQVMEFPLPPEIQPAAVFKA